MFPEVKSKSGRREPAVRECYDVLLMFESLRWQAISRYSWFSVAIVAVLVAGILTFRWWGSRRAEEQLREQRIERQRAEDQRVFEMLGGNRFEIMSFYATPGITRRGEPIQLCYGVSNAKTVRLEPQTNPVWPSVARCVYVSPDKDTTYTLTIEDGAGHTKTATLLVQVR